MTRERQADLFINGLTAKAQAGHLSPAEHRDLSTAITHLSDALTTTPSD